jgi:hypothetical protein
VIDLGKILAAQGWRVERESGTAFFYNFAPWIAPKAYLHIVFRGASTEALDLVGRTEMRLPESWLDTLSQQNGASLFSGAMDIYGLHSPGTLLRRTDIYERLPFNIASETRSWPVMPVERYVRIGGYGYDGTGVVLDRESGAVLAIPRKSETVARKWPDADTWINLELARLVILFDSEGKIQAANEDTVPKIIQ